MKCKMEGSVFTKLNKSQTIKIKRRTNMTKHNFSALDPVKNRRMKMCLDIFYIVAFAIVMTVIYNIWAKS